MSRTFASPNPTHESAKSLDQAITETLAYSDIFDYPLTLDELHRYLVTPATKEEVENCILNMDQVRMKDGYYFLADRAEIVEIRKSRTEKSRKAFNRALFYGKLLGILPFVRMVSITGSLAVLNFSKVADMDYMLVTKSHRLWLARAFAVTFGRLMCLFGDRICVNLLVSENALSWHLHDLYSAREMCQMVSVVGFDVYHRLRNENKWTESILPNALSLPSGFEPNTNEKTSLIQKLFEFLLLGKLGLFAESIAMRLQLRYIYARYGSGMEANFSADLCQGNFHDHRKWADEFFHERLSSLHLQNKAF